MRRTRGHAAHAVQAFACAPPCCAAMRWRHTWPPQSTRGFPATRGCRPSPGPAVSPRDRTSQIVFITPAMPNEMRQRFPSKLLSDRAIRCNQAWRTHADYAVFVCKSTLDTSSMHRNRNKPDQATPGIMRCAPTSAILGRHARHLMRSPDQTCKSARTPLYDAASGRCHIPIQVIVRVIACLPALPTTRSRGPA